MLVALDTSHLEISLLNDDASANMAFMLVTLDTSHFERSPLNNDAEEPARVPNDELMSVTADTSQDPIGPYRPLEQSVGESLRHSAMAALISSLEFGAQPVVRYPYKVTRFGSG